MKVIDLLNKIANNEEVPKQIVFHEVEWVLKNKHKYCIDYYSTGMKRYLFCDEWALTNNLNDEIEIIEEKPKKIEELENIKECFAGVEIEYNENAPQYKLNQLIRNQKNIAKAVNYLLEKESDK